MAIDSEILVKIREAVWKSIRVTHTDHRHTDTQTHKSSFIDKITLSLNTNHIQLGNL